MIRFGLPMTISFRPLMALAALGFLIFSGPAMAADGILNSVAYGKVPAKASMVVEAFDDSDNSETLRRDFTKAVTSAGYTASEDGTLLFIFEVRDELGAFSTRDRRHILSLETKGGRLGGGQDSQAKVNVFDSTSGGLLNRGQGGTTTIVTPSSYRIDVSVENRSTGKTLWQGWAIAETRSSVGLELTRRMVPRLVDAIGKTIREERFSLYE